MKNLPFYSILLLLILGCKEQPKTNYTINGNAQGVYNGVRVYLNDVNERGIPKPIDTAMVMNESFVFNGGVDYPKLMYITVNGVPGRLPVIIENENLTLTIDNKILSNSTLTGSKSNKIFNDYNSELQKLKTTIQEASKNLKSSNFLKDSIRMNSDQIAFDKANEAFSDFQYKYLEDNSDSYGILPILSLLSKGRNADFDRLINIYDNLGEPMKNTSEGQQINTTLNQIKVRLEAEKATAIGAKASEFSAPTPQGTSLALSDVLKKGKITIIDFWAAWCGPCRRENPNVVKVYEKYHDKGLEIIGVGLDGRRGQQSPKEAWIKAIEDDNLTWHQVSNLRYFGEIAKLYNVSSIPAMFVLDSDGKIIAKNLRGPALEKKIAEILN